MFLTKNLFCKVKKGAGIKKKSDEKSHVRNVTVFVLHD